MLTLVILAWLSCLFSRQHWVCECVWLCDCPFFCCLSSESQHCFFIYFSLASVFVCARLRVRALVCVCVCLPERLCFQRSLVITALFCHYSQIHAYMCVFMYVYVYMCTWKRSVCPSIIAWSVCNFSQFMKLIISDPRVKITLTVAVERQGTLTKRSKRALIHTHVHR